MSPVETPKPATPATETPATAPVAEVAAPAAAELSADPMATFSAEMKRFRTAFGEKGPCYFDDGLSFEEASARHVKELVDANTQLTAKNVELAKKLSDATGQPQGELTAVGFQAADEKKKAGFASKIHFAGAARA